MLLRHLECVFLPFGFGSFLCSAFFPFLEAAIFVLSIFVSGCWEVRVVSHAASGAIWLWQQIKQNVQSLFPFSELLQPLQVMIANPLVRHYLMT